MPACLCLNKKGFHLDRKGIDIKWPRVWCSTAFYREKKHGIQNYRKKYNNLLSFSFRLNNSNIEWVKITLRNNTLIVIKGGTRGDR